MVKSQRIRKAILAIGMAAVAGVAAVAGLQRSAEATCSGCNGTMYGSCTTTDARSTTCVSGNSSTNKVCSDPWHPDCG